MSEYENIAEAFAEGLGRDKLRDRSLLEHGSKTDLPIFYRYVIIETISDPSIIDAVKLDYWERDLNVSNIKHATVAPRNSVIARRIVTNASTHSENVMILYPFMPQHLAMPSKPGEIVWVTFEHQSGTKNDLGYWLWKIVGPTHVDDTNYSHYHRANDPSFVPGIKDIFNGEGEPVYEIKNGDAGVEDGERFTKAETASIPSGDEDEYKKLLLDSDGGKLSAYEPVPRYKKRPGDQVIEGSNNTIIVLGRNRTGPIAEYESTDNMGQVPQDQNPDIKQGSIDLIVGLGQTAETGAEPVENDAGFEEIKKGNLDSNPNEGNPDYSADRSRILMSLTSKIDEDFDLTSFNSSNFSGGAIDGGADSNNSVQDSSDGQSGIVIKTDKIRLIARSDVEFIVTGHTLDDNGKMVTNTDESKWCAVVLKTNGDIVIKPADQSYIKLGGDNADKALICTDAPAPAVNGKIAPAAVPPILTTMGGQFATGVPGQGMLATKILVVGEK